MPHAATQPQIVTVPCLQDNFAFLLHEPTTGATAVIDVPEAAPVAAALSARGWHLSDILLTHHHGDHVQGVDALIKSLPEGPTPRVVGAAADAYRLPPLDLAVAPGDAVRVGALTLSVLDASGHTVGHIAYHAPEAAAVFTADSLMAMGCGRLFEGTPAQMWDTLSRLAALPEETTVYSGHDYLAANAAFALWAEPDNAAAIQRAAAHRMGVAGHLFVTLAIEKATNPFLRAALPALRSKLGLPVGTPAAEVFAALRAAKDTFRG